MAEPTVEVAIDAVRPHPRNPRRGNVEAVKESIRTLGFKGSIIVQRSTGFILAGNHRWMAAKELGYATIPVTYDDVDDKRAIAFLLSDNRTHEIGLGYDEDGVDRLLTELRAPDPAMDGEDFGALLSALDWGTVGPDGKRPVLPVPATRYEVLVACGDEAEQKATAKRLSGLGFRCRTLTTRGDTFD